MSVKKRLNKSSLKALGVDIVEGRELIEDIVENASRRYPIHGNVLLYVRTNQGTLHVALSPGFSFDGRSGPKIVDWYAPNLGTLEERLCWLVHDANGYGQDLSFGDTNVLLYAMLRDLAGYRKTKAAVIQLAVSLSESWYGEPKPDDWCFANVDKVSTLWI